MPSRVQNALLQLGRRLLTTLWRAALDLAMHAPVGRAASTVFEAWSQLQALSTEAEAEAASDTGADTKQTGGTPATKPPLRGVKIYHRLRKLVMQGQAAGASATTRSVFESLDAQLSAHMGAGTGSNLSQHGIVVVGAGPAGLRVAIELALVGAQIAVVEQSPEWPYVPTRTPRTVVDNCS